MLRYSSILLHQHDINVTPLPHFPPSLQLSHSLSFLHFVYILSLLLTDTIYPTVIYEMRKCMHLAIKGLEILHFALNTTIWFVVIKAFPVLKYTIPSSKSSMSVKPQNVCHVCWQLRTFYSFKKWHSIGLS